MKALVSQAVHHWRLCLLFLVLSIISGIICFQIMPKEADPDIPIPFISVFIPMEGISPEDSERMIIRPTEKELKNLKGIKEINSAGMSSGGFILIEFEADFNQIKALNEVRNRVDLARRFYPKDSKEPIIEEVNASLTPVINVILYGNQSERSLFQIAKAYQARLEALPNVLEAKLSGARKDYVEIILDPAKIEQYGITIDEIKRAAFDNNQLIATGVLLNKKTNFSVKVKGIFETVEDIKRIPVRTDNKSVIALEDIAEVKRHFKDRTSYAKHNGKPALILEVKKKLGSNIIETTKSVREATKIATKNWPDSIQYDFSIDLSSSIKNSMKTLTSSIGLAIILVMIITVAALGIRSGLLVGISIPSSFMIAFLFLYISNYNINFMVLFGMVLAVGILVDSSIVVVEHANKLLETNLSPKEAFIKAGQDMFWPIISSTATTLSAFIPFLFWKTIPGKYMSFLPITLSYVLMASVLMALIFIPVLGSLFFKPFKNKKTEKIHHAPSKNYPENKTLRPNWYTYLVKTLIQYPIIVIFSILSLTTGIFIWFKSTPHKIVFFIEANPEQVFVFVRARGNLAPMDHYRLAKQVEEKIKSINGIKSIDMTTGSRALEEGFGSGASSIPQDTIARLMVDFLPFEQRRNGLEIEKDIRNALVNIPGIIVEVRPFEVGPPIGKDIQIELSGDTYDELTSVTQQIRKLIDQTEGLTDQEDTLPVPGLEWQFDINRKEAFRSGLNVSDVSAAIQLITNGVLIGYFRPDDSEEEIDIRVRYPASERNINRLSSLSAVGKYGNTDLTPILSKKIAQKIYKIDRRNNHRIFEIRANVKKGYYTETIIKSIKNQFKQTPSINKSAVSIKFKGANEENAKAMQFFMTAMLVSMFLMTCILLLQFNSFWHVFLTLLSVILSFFGVLLAIQISMPYISVLMVGTGMIALAGIVVNNNIVLIDTYQFYRKKGLAVKDAALKASLKRARPVLLTTLTTVLGLLPMALKVSTNFTTGEFSFKGGPSSEWWQPLSLTVIWGLSFATFITLISTPVLLAFPEIIKTRLANLYSTLKSKFKKS